MKLFFLSRQEKRKPVTVSGQKIIMQDADECDLQMSD